MNNDTLARVMGDNHSQSNTQKQSQRSTIVPQSIRTHLINSYASGSEEREFTLHRLKNRRGSSPSSLQKLIRPDHQIGLGRCIRANSSSYDINEKKEKLDNTNDPLLLLTSSQVINNEKNGLTRFQSCRRSDSSCGSLTQNTTTTSHNSFVSHSKNPLSRTVPNRQQHSLTTVPSTNKVWRSQSLGRNYKSESTPPNNEYKEKRQYSLPKLKAEIDQIGFSSKQGESEGGGLAQANSRPSLADDTEKCRSFPNSKSRTIQSPTLHAESQIDADYHQSPEEQSRSPHDRGPRLKQMTRFCSPPRLKIEKQKVQEKEEIVKSTMNNNDELNTIMNNPTITSSSCFKNNKTNIQVWSGLPSTTNFIEHQKNATQSNRRGAMSQEYVPNSCVDENDGTVPNISDKDPLHSNQRRIGRSFSVSQTIVSLDTDSDINQPRERYDSSFLKRQEAYSKRHHYDDTIRKCLPATDRICSKSYHDSGGPVPNRYRDSGGIVTNRYRDSGGRVPNPHRDCSGFITEKRRSSSRPSGMSYRYLFNKKSSMDTNNGNAFRDRVVTELRNYSTSMDKQTLINYFKRENEHLDLRNSSLLNSSLERNEAVETRGANMASCEGRLCEDCSLLTIENRRLREELMKEMRRSAVIAAHRERQEIQIDDAEQLLSSLLQDSDGLPVWIETAIYHVIDILRGKMIGLSSDYINQYVHPLSSSLLSPPTTTSPTVNLHRPPASASYQRRHPNSDSSPIRLPRSIPPILPLDSEIIHKRLVPILSSSARQRRDGRCGSSQQPASSRTATPSLLHDDVDDEQAERLSGTTRTSSRPRSVPNAPPLQSPTSLSSIKSPKPETLMKEGKDELYQENQIEAKRVRLINQHENNDDDEEEEEIKGIPFRKTYPMDDEKTINHRILERLKSDTEGTHQQSLMSTDGGRQQRKGPMIPPLGLKEVGRGSWLSGGQTQGDTYNND